MSEQLTVARRQSHGKRGVRRLRQSGRVPAVLYGHGDENLSLEAAADELAAVIRHGARVVDLQGAVSEKALIKAVQWDTYGLEVLHFDLARVSADERLKVKVSVEMRGESQGAKAGGIVTLLVHDVDIECAATSIPEKLFIRVHELNIGGELLASAIELPAGARLISDAEMAIVHCVQPKSEAELELHAAPGAEPEVIGRKAEEEGDDE